MWALLAQVRGVSVEGARQAEADQREAARRTVERRHPRADPARWCALLDAPLVALLDQVRARDADTERQLANGADAYSVAEAAEREQARQPVDEAPDQAQERPRTLGLSVVDIRSRWG